MLGFVYSYFVSSLLTCCKQLSDKLVIGLDLPKSENEENFSFYDMSTLTWCLLMLADGPIRIISFCFGLSKQMLEIN